jgi:hypothetical protein
MALREILDRLETANVLGLKYDSANRTLNLVLRTPIIDPDLGVSFDEIIIPETETADFDTLVEFLRDRLAMSHEMIDIFVDQAKASPMSIIYF